MRDSSAPQGTSPAEVLPKAYSAARKAVEIDPRSAEAHASLALVLNHKWDWSGADYQRMRRFMEKYEFFVLPVNQVLPFDVKTHYPTDIAGVKMETYIAWMKSAYYVSTVGNPAISVPCAFSDSGLPIGIQIVGRHNDDWGVPQMANAFEQTTNIGKRQPPIV